MMAIRIRLFRWGNPIRMNQTRMPDCESLVRIHNFCWFLKKEQLLDHWYPNFVKKKFRGGTSRFFCNSDLTKKISRTSIFMIVSSAWRIMYFSWFIRCDRYCHFPHPPFSGRWRKYKIKHEKILIWNIAKDLWLVCFVGFGSVDLVW